MIIGIVGIIIGAVITWFISYHYYKRASDELLKEANELRKLNVLILRALENAGLAKLNRDENGNCIGLQITFSSKMRGESETSSPNLDLR